MEQKTQTQKVKFIGRRIFYDQDGEPVSFLVIGQRPSLHKDTGFLKIFISFLDDIISDKEIANKSIRLLLYMLKKLKYENLEISVTCEEATKNLNISKRTFYEWISTLQKKQIITRKGSNLYELQLYAVVRGNMHRLAKQIEQQSQQ